ncbi:helicase HerA-like domain-containing protein [Paenisporosarcina macmurdoensis]|uniref:Helicase HerA-like domain-containing protein n=1 Tax=Paenisporosarcina macmurdoensis TaxID=212659 RepID=A0ABW1LDS2_9BACL
MVERALVLPPRSLIGIVTNEKRQELIHQSEMKDKYQDRVDKESAYELLKIKTEKIEITLEKETYDYGKTKSKVRPKKSEFQKVAQSLINTVGRQIGRELIRGIFGALKRK